MPLRVLQIVTTMNRGGLETMLMNYYRHIDRSKVQFDFLVHRQEEGDYEKEILSLGGKIYRVPTLNPFSPAYFKALNQFFSEHKYSVVHSHLDCMSAVPLSVAKKHGVKHRFAHAHSSNQDHDFKYPIKLIFKRLIKIYATDFLACGIDAGNWMFGGSDFTVIRNSIDAKKYIYSPEKYISNRKKLNLENCFTVCHVGRFSLPKNHAFIIDVFCELLKREPQAKLLLIGEGELQGEIEKKVNECDINSSVNFLGLRNDVDVLLNASDVFLFPSIYEGVSLATVEAQAAGLPCVFSDNIPKECKLIDNVDFISLSSSAEIWAECVLKYRNFQKKNEYRSISATGYDIELNSEQLEKLYLNKVGINNG